MRGYWHALDSTSGSIPPSSTRRRTSSTAPSPPSTLAGNDDIYRILFTFDSGYYPIGGGIDDRKAVSKCIGHYYIAPIRSDRQAMRVPLHRYSSYHFGVGRISADFQGTDSTGAAIGHIKELTVRATG